MHYEIDYKPTPRQLELHEDPTRFKVAVFGRRSGKSTFAINETIKTCLEKKGAKVWITTPTFNQAKDIYWRGSDMLNKFLLSQMYIKKNDSELLIEFKNGSILQFKGADRPETMRGSALDLLIEDEVSEHRYAKETWEQILLPSLSDKQGRAVFIGTPKGYNFFYDLYTEGTKENGYWKSWKIPTWESGAPWTLTPEGQAEIKRLKAEMTEDAFMQEYGADFRRYTGLVFKDFDRGIHVHNFEVKKEFPMELGQDFGWENPTVVIFSYFDKDDEWWIFDEYYEVKKDYLEHSGRLKAKKEGYFNSMKYVVGDSEDPQAITEYGKYGWYVTPIVKEKNSVLTGISRISERMKVNPMTKKPRIHIHPRCENLIKELERYRWKEKKEEWGNEKDEPEKAYDHAIDAMRYIILHHSKQVKEEKIEPVKYTYRPAGGY